MFKKEINRHYLYAGDVFATATPTEVSTVLGSCISVCLWDPVRGIGGINHYVSPVWDAKDPESNKYAETSIYNLISKMLSLGANKEKLICYVFGGGRVADLHLDVGAENIRAAEKVLRDKEIRVTDWEVGNEHGRKLLFNTCTGEIKLYRIRSLTEQLSGKHLQPVSDRIKPLPPGAV